MLVSEPRSCPLPPTQSTNCLSTDNHNHFYLERYSLLILQNGILEQLSKILVRTHRRTGLLSCDGANLFDTQHVVVGGGFANIIDGREADGMDKFETACLEARWEIGSPSVDDKWVSVGVQSL